VDANVAEMLITTGIQAWRDPAAFPGLGTSASSVVISGTKSSLSLGRTQGNWGVLTPIREAADPEAVARLFAILNSVRIVDFRDIGPPSHTGLDSPAAMLRLSSGSPSAAPGGDEQHEGYWYLIVGAAAGIADNTFVAELGHGKNRGQVVIVAGEQLAAISTDPLHYVSRQALRVEPAEIGHIAVTSPSTQLPCKRGEFRRTLEGWEARCDQGEWKPAMKADVQAVEALIELCTSTIPERMEVCGTQELAATSMIEVGTAGGTPLGSLSILIDGTRLTIMSEHVLRGYAAGVGGTVAEWLGRR